MYLVFWVNATLGLDPYLTIIITVPFAFFLGLLVFVIFVQPILEHPPMNKILMTLGLAVIMENLALIIFSPDFRNVNSKISESKIVAGRRIYSHDSDCGNIGVPRHDA